MGTDTTVALVQQEENNAHFVIKSGISRRYVERDKQYRHQSTSWMTGAMEMRKVNNGSMICSLVRYQTMIQIG